MIIKHDQFSLGGLPACCCCNATFRCADSGCGTVAVTIRDPAPSGALVAAGTVAPGGSLSLPIPAAGTYDVTFSGGTCTAPNTQALDLACGGSDAAPCCVCSGNLCVIDCDTGLPIGGATISYSGGGCTADATGCCTFVTGCSLTLGVTVGAAGYQTYTGTVTVACDATETICLVPAVGVNEWAICFMGCCSTPLSGVTVTLSNGQTQTTGPTGCVDFQGVPAEPNMTYTYSKPRWAGQTLPLAPPSGVGNTWTVYPTPASGYHCGAAWDGGNIQDPLPDTLSLTDSVYGGTQLVWDGQGWAGVITAQDPGVCGCPGGTPFTIDYYLNACGTVNLTFLMCALMWEGAMVSLGCAGCEQDGAAASIPIDCPPDSGIPVGPGFLPCYLDWYMNCSPMGLRSVPSPDVPYQLIGEVPLPPYACDGPGLPPGQPVPCWWEIYKNGASIQVTE